MLAEMEVTSAMVLWIKHLIVIETVMNEKGELNIRSYIERWWYRISVYR